MDQVWIRSSKIHIHPIKKIPVPVLVSYLSQVRSGWIKLKTWISQVRSGISGYFDLFYLEPKNF